MGHVVSIVYRPAKAGRPQGHYARTPVERVRLVEFKGIEGDTKGGTGKRQLNVMLAEEVTELRGEGFKAGPGELGEQIVVGGLPAGSLVPGARLRLGSAVIEITMPRVGCERFERIQGKPRDSAAGRLGALARVVTGGEVAVGDPVELLPAED